MAFPGKTVANTFKDILQIDNSNAGISTSLLVVKDGTGNQSSLYISDDQIKIQPENDDTTALLEIQDKDGDQMLLVDSTNDVIKSFGHHLNTNIKEFGMGAADNFPTTTDTWTALQSCITGKTDPEVQAGTGITPSTAFTISTTADDMVSRFWYVPFDITIDSVHVWLGADAASGDVVKFSLMSYTVDSANGSTGGDLSSGVENCKSGATITGAGYEQAYYQSLTVSTANVDSGKAIMVFVSQNGTNADLTINMQLVYHLR